MLHSRLLSVAFLLAPLMVQAQAEHAPADHLTHYSSTIECRRDGSAHVATSVQFSTRANQPISLVIRHLGDGEVTHLTIQDAAGKVLPMQLRSLTSGSSITASPASGQWSVDYDVVPTSGVVTKVPLPVPSLPLPAGVIANITLKIPPGDALYGDLFPRMTVDSDGDAHGSALGVPSLALVRHKPAQQVSKVEAMITSSNLANLTMLVMFFFGLSIIVRKLRPSSVALER